MAVQYWVGDFFVDLSRNQITQREQSQTIAPKALAVLTYLAKNKGRVVSYDELFSQVWPDTIVTPNTLQRSIAQLRKALGEDSKRQSCIKTHAKQGYSLECNVTWSNENQADLETHFTHGQETSARFDTVIESTPVGNSAFSRLILGLACVVTAAAVLALIGFNYFEPKPTSQLSFDQLRSLTATDDKEYGAIYSPDGEYIVFQRYPERVCLSNLWAKNTATQQETRLTKELGTYYGSHSFSVDGKKLAFVLTEDCDKPATQKSCFNLMSLDFPKALDSPQPSKLMVQCKDSVLRDPVWLDNDNILVMQNSSNRWQLIRYSISENESTVLFEVEDGNLVAFDYSVGENLIAVTSIHDDGLHYIEMLKPDGELLSSHAIEYPQELSKFRLVYPHFDPSNHQLIFSSGRLLFTLSYDGHVSRISLPLAEKIESPSFHPDGGRLLLIKKWYDSDIASIPFHQTKEKPVSSVSLQTKQLQSDANAPHTILERSTLGDQSAIFQPNGELIAFTSERSGEDQVWIYDGKDSTQISTFAENTFISGIDWAADGKSVLVGANQTLTQVFLDRSRKNVLFQHPVVKLFQWDSENNTALLATSIGGVFEIGELNLTNSEFRVIPNKKTKWARKSEDGRLIYIDRMGRFWQPGPFEDQLIEALDGQGSSKGFVIKNNVIYGINKENQLWLYDLDKADFKILKQLHENVDHLSDINQTHFLIELAVAEKKEVVELTIRN